MNEMAEQAQDGTVYSEAEDQAHQPPYQFAAYRSSLQRGPSQALIHLPSLYDGFEYGQAVEGQAHLGARFRCRDKERDLIRNGSHGGPPIGERIVVSGRVLDANGAPVVGALVEIWQANASGRYLHKVDQHDAPLDPNFLGAGRCISDRDGGYRFYTIKPGAYPWQNHANAWRPQHIHFSVLGNSLGQRLVTQMYFPGDPLLALDPIFGAVPRAAAARLISSFDLGITEPEFALGYRFDIVLAGTRATPAEEDAES